MKQTDEEETKPTEQQELPLPAPKKKVVVSVKKKPEPAKAEAKPSGDPGFIDMDLPQLLEAYVEMGATLKDISGDKYKLDALPQGALLFDVRKACENAHAFINKVRGMKDAGDAYSKQRKAKIEKKQTQSAGAKSAESTKPANTAQEKTTMATKKAVKKSAAKKTAKPAKKAAPAKKADAAAKWAGFELTQKFKVVNAENPAREGTSKWKRWNALLSMKSGTIEAAKKAKINTGTFRNAVKARNVKVD